MFILHYRIGSYFCFKSFLKLILARSISSGVKPVKCSENSALRFRCCVVDICLAFRQSFGQTGYPDSTNALGDN